MRRIILVMLFISTTIAQSASPMFRVKMIANKNGQESYLTVRPKPSSRTYPYAGINLTNSGYSLVNSSDCTMQSNGWCTFSFSSKQPKTFRIKRTSQSVSSRNITFRLALNARGRDPISTQMMTVSEQEAGRIIGYLYGWESPPDASAIAAAGYTHVLIAFGLFSTTSPGTINIDDISGFDLATYVQSLHDSGLKVLLSIGGASTSISNTTVDFDAAIQLASSPSAFETTFINNMTSLVSTYGFDGFDFDIEQGFNAAYSFSAPSTNCSNDTYDSACDIFYLTTIINNFHTQSPDSMLTLAPQIANISATPSFSSIWGNYASLIMQTYSSLTWVGFQNYNSGCAYGINLVCYPTTGTLTSTADPAVAFATDLLASWPATISSGQETGFQPYISYLQPSQVVIGYTVNNSSGQSDGSPAADTSVAQNVIECLSTNEDCDTYTPPSTYSGIGGVFSWTINYDATTGYQFATNLYPCVIQGNCT